MDVMKVFVLQIDDEKVCDDALRWRPERRTRRLKVNATWTWVGIYETRRLPPL